MPFSLDAPVMEVPVGILPYRLVKKFEDIVAVSTAYRGVTDRRTERQTNSIWRRHSLRYA